MCLLQGAVENFPEGSIGLPGTKVVIVRPVLGGVSLRLVRYPPGVGNPAPMIFMDHDLGNTGFLVDLDLFRWVFPMFINRFLQCIQGNLGGSLNLRLGAVFQNEVHISSVAVS